jgi:KDO2-lipid IV(A) lauroyltransferase
MSYYIALFFSKIFCLLSAGFCRRLGDLLGALTWPIVPQKRKRLATDQIQFCLKVSGQEAERIAKKSWTRFGSMFIEVMRFPVMKDHIEKYVKIEGRENIEKGLALGCGGIIATAHSGNWELLGAALALSGFPIVGVAMKQKEAGMDRFINDYRRLVGMHVTYKTSVREMFSMLKEGWIIGLLMDQDASRHDGILLEFFGRETNCVQGPASLARFKAAPIFPTFITQNEDGTHTIIIHKPVFVEKTQDKHEDIRRTTAILTKIIEDHIRKYPEEWFWLHDRWKSVRK